MVNNTILWTNYWIINMWKVWLSNKINIVYLNGGKVKIITLVHTAAFIDVCIDIYVMMSSNLYGTCRHYLSATLSSKTRHNCNPFCNYGTRPSYWHQIEILLMFSIPESCDRLGTQGTLRSGLSGCTLVTINFTEFLVTSSKTPASGNKVCEMSIEFCRNRIQLTS